MVVIRYYYFLLSFLHFKYRSFEILFLMFLLIVYITGLTDRPLSGKLHANQPSQYVTWQVQ